MVQLTIDWAARCRPNYSGSVPRLSAKWSLLISGEHVRNDSEYHHGCEVNYVIQFWYLHFRHFNYFIMALIFVDGVAYIYG